MNESIFFVLLFGILLAKNFFLCSKMAKYFMWLLYTYCIFTMVAAPQISNAVDDLLSSTGCYGDFFKDGMTCPPGLKFSALSMIGSTFFAVFLFGTILSIPISIFVVPYIIIVEILHRRRK